MWLLTALHLVVFKSNERYRTHARAHTLSLSHTLTNIFQMEHLQNRKHDFYRLSVEYKHWDSFHLIFPVFAEHWLLHLLYYKLANNRKLYLSHVLPFYPYLSSLITTFALIIGKTIFPIHVLVPPSSCTFGLETHPTRQEPAYLLSDFPKLPGRVLPFQTLTKHLPCILWIISCFLEFGIQSWTYISTKL